MKKYAELCGNIQKYRIKSLYGNKLNMEHNLDTVSKITPKEAMSLAKTASIVMDSPILKNMLSGNKPVDKPVEKILGVVSMRNMGKHCPATK